MKKINICLISNEYPPETGFGGIGTYTYNLAHGLANLGHKVTVISKATNKEKDYLDKKVRVFRILDKKTPIKGFTRIANIFTKGAYPYYLHSKSVFLKISELIKAGHKFDIIESPLWDVESLTYKRDFGIPLVVRLETPIFKLREILKLSQDIALEKLEETVLQNATLIGSISKSITSIVSKKYNIDPGKILPTPLGIYYPPIKKPLFNKNSFKLLYVSRLEQRKGTQEFIESLPKILTSNKEVTVDIIGKDILQAPGDISFFSFFQKIVPINLQKKVKFHGFVSKDKLDKFYEDCDLFITPSRYESFGLVFLEAMGYGKPVIGTRVGGIQEIVKDGVVGLLIDTNSPKQIADTILKIFANEKLRKDMGIKAFYYVRKEFSLEKMIRTTLSLYNKAISQYSTK